MKLVLLLVAFTAVYTVNTDITGENQLFPDEQVDDTSIGETQRVPIGPENQNIDEEVQQMKENYEMGSVSDHRSSMTKERKRCIPNPLCTRAGGYCVKKSRDCNGTLDSYGCRGSKKCKCCIPDDIICGLAPTTVEPTTTSVQPSTADPTPIETTDFEYFNGRYIRHPQLSDGRMTFEASLNLCASFGATSFIPKTQEDFDLLVLALKEKLDDSYMWVPANDIDSEGQLKWPDNTDASGSTGLRWCNNQTLHSNNDNNDCGEIGWRCSDAITMAWCGYTDIFPMICEILF